MPPPLPEVPPEQRKRFAATISLCIRLGVAPESLADLGLTSQGVGWIRNAALQDAAAIARSFRDDCPAELASIEGGQLERFLAGFILRCKEIVAAIPPEVILQ
ncbi:hypothetical protein EPO44_10325 [bacterium]|nr:MAG: hypothetical protein EPO44_10325 [bacterium]